MSDAVRRESIPTDAWSLKAAIMRAAALAYEWWWQTPDLRLELNLGHVNDLERLVRDSGWRIEGHGPMRVMTQAGEAKIMWTWPDMDSVSMLDASRDGRRVIVRRAIDGGKTK
jgi:hypothetical protein